MKTNEEKALAVGNDPRQLKRRLLEARSVLVDSLRRRFEIYCFDPVQKRLVSEDRRLALQWKVRRLPSSPPSYENQQTSRGTVSIIELPGGNGK